MIRWVFSSGDSFTILEPFRLHLQDFMEELHAAAVDKPVIHVIL
jgi:hypothetical protein